MPNFSVTNLTSGRVFTVQQHETVLDSVLRKGFAVPYNCRNGSCASCKAKLVSGNVRYEPYDKNAMSDEEVQNGSVLLCRAYPTSDLEIKAKEISLHSSVSIQRLPCRVIELNPLTHDVMQIFLALPRNTTFNFIPGQYIDVMMRDKKRRGFSIASPPGKDILELHVRLIPKGRFTTHIFRAMEVKDILHLEGPLGTFFLRQDSDRPIIMIAGSTGIAPVNSIIESSLTTKLERPIHLFWGVRSKKDIYLNKTVDSWIQNFGDKFKFTAVLSEPQPEDIWEGEIGWVHEAVLRQYADLSGYEVYASGPPPMVEAIRKELSDSGLDLDFLYYDSFDFSSDNPNPNR